MTNARKEFEAVTLIPRIIHEDSIKCAYIRHAHDCEDGGKIFLLKVRHTKDDYEEFLKSLDFEYDAGFGCQELFGYIWLNDGTWYERHEYDGSENWEYKSMPPIPNELER